MCLPPAVTERRIHDDAVVQAAPPSEKICFENLVPLCDKHLAVQRAHLDADRPAEWQVVGQPTNPGAWLKAEVGRANVGHRDGVESDRLRGREKLVGAGIARNQTPQFH